MIRNPFINILDDRTSDICRALSAQDKVYPLNDALEVMDNLMALDTKSNSLDDAREYIKALGEDAFGAYVENHIAKKTEKAIRLLLFRGDRASATAKLKALDGIIKLATAASKVTN